VTARTETRQYSKPLGEFKERSQHPV
jgi:hypothetical protein